MSCTVAIPTRRHRFLRSAVESALNQTYEGLEVLLVDNSDRPVLERLGPLSEDRRFRYERNPQVLDMIANWNRCLELARSEWLLILGDDDVLERECIARCANAVGSPVAFAFGRCIEIDETDQVIGEWGRIRLAAGLHPGPEYIKRTVQLGYNLTNSSATMFSVPLLRSIGGFLRQRPANSFDFNAWLRLAGEGSVIFIDEPLCRYRVHGGQVSSLHWRQAHSGPVATKVELLRAVATLLELGETTPARAVADVRKMSSELADDLAMGWMPEF